MAYSFWDDIIETQEAVSRLPEAQRERPQAFLTKAAEAMQEYDEARADRWASPAERRERREAVVLYLRLAKAAI